MSAKENARQEKCEESGELKIEKEKDRERERESPRKRSQLTINLKSDLQSIFS